jgi:hypothetical protein
MRCEGGYLEEVGFIGSVVSPAVEERYPSKANREVMSLYDLMAFAVMAHRHYEVYKRAYSLFIEELELFAKMRYNKLVEKLNRYGRLLLGCPKLFEFKGLNIVDSKSIETKRLARFGRHRKRGTSAVMGEGESIGFNPSKGDST